METITIGSLVLTVAPMVGEETILNLAKAHHIAVSHFENDGRWRFEPLTDSIIIPAEGRRRMKLVEETGIEVEWIIAHELPPKPINWPEISGEDWEILGQVLLVVVGIAAVIAVAPLLIIGLAACSSNDPALIAKVRNSKGKEAWIDLYRWY